jgi:hypothetical protein
MRVSGLWRPAAAGGVSGRRPDKSGGSSILVTILQALPHNFTAYTWDVAASASPVTQTLSLQPSVNSTANVSYTTTYLRRHGKVRCLHMRARTGMCHVHASVANAPRTHATAVCRPPR